jgi:hypothetical protein
MTAGRSNEPAHNGRWQTASATIAPNESYVGARLQFRGAGDVEHGMIDTADRPTARHILRRLMRGVLILVVLGVGRAVFPLTPLYDEYNSSSDILDLYGILTILTYVWMALVLLMPIRQTLSEWSLVVDDRAALSESAYATVAEELLRRRQIPAQVFPRRIRVGRPQPGIRNFLLVKLGKYFMFVSVFAFGRDLYLGWSLIRRDIPIIFLLRYFAAKLGTDPGFSRLIDIEPVKALREVVHNALRTGIEAAAVGRQISVDSVFNRPIPVDEDPAHGPAASFPTR